MSLEELFLIKVENIMTRQVLTVSENESVLDAVKKMETLNVGAVIIVDKSEKIAGIFSERDLLKRVVPKEKDPSSTPVKEVMTKELVSMKSDTLLTEAFQIFQNRNIRHAPIVDNDNLVGIISIKDVNSVIYKQLAQALFDDE